MRSLLETHQFHAPRLRDASRVGHGRGRLRSAGVICAVVIRRPGPVEGSELTTSGSYRLFSAYAIAADQALRLDVSTIGAEMIRREAPPQTTQATDSGAVPSGRWMSKLPSVSQRYS